MLDDLDSVEYHFEGNPENPVLVWEPRERQIGPDVLRPSMGIYAAGSGELRFELEAQYVRRWLNGYGGQWRNRVQLGTSSLFQTSLYQPLEKTQTFFVEPGGLIGRSTEDIYNDYKRIAQYFFIDYGGRLDVGVNLGSNSQLRAGYWVDERRVEVNTGLSLLPTDKNTDAGLLASGYFDNRDASTFATRGTAAEIQFFRSDSGLGATRSWEILEGGARQVLRAGVTTLSLTAAAWLRPRQHTARGPRVLAGRSAELSRLRAR